MSVIAFGATLILSANWMRELHVVRPSLRISRNEMIAEEMASRRLACSRSGMTAVVLGSLAVCGVNPPVLMLLALIVLGGSIVLRPAPQPALLTANRPAYTRA